MSDLVRGAKSAPLLPPPVRRPAGAERPAAVPRVPEPGPETEPVRMAAVPTTREPTDVPASTTPEAAAAAAETLFAELARFLEGVRDVVATWSAMPWPELERLLGRVLDALEQSGELFWVANRPAVPPDVDYVAFHQARVAVLAMRVGANAGLPRRHLLELGTAACLIDVGFWQLPSSLLRRLDALTAEEQAQYRAHPRVSADLVRRWGPPYEGVVDAILQHHEREQGQGFPQGLSAGAIRLEAKILGLVDTYTGLTAPASLRAGLKPHRAIREIVRSKREAFPPALIKALLRDISVFPPGTLVRLNSGEIGCVIAVNRNHPLRPRIEVYAARGQRPASPKVIDLSEAPFLYITGPVSESAR